MISCCVNNKQKKMRPLCVSENSDDIKLIKINITSLVITFHSFKQLQFLKRKCNDDYEAAKSLSEMT